ncbi:MAG: hypothetical protein Q9168_001874 [Polycauliona sp. 1 TL-2023]
MARIQIPIDALTSRLNLGSRFEGVRSQSLSTRFANLRPISEFLNLSRLSKPANFGEVQSRVNYNLGYFSSNYVAVGIMLLIYSLLTNLTLLFDIVFVCLGLFAIKKLHGRDLELGFARATTSQLYTGLFVIAVPLLIWANPISSALWLVGATGVSILGARPRTPKFTPPWGRSSGSNTAAGGEPQDRHFEEIDSDDDDGQGVTLDSSYFSDEPDSTAPDMGRHTRIRRKPIHEPDSYSSDEAETFDGRSSSTMQLALRNKEDLLVQQALGRIQRAQMLGKHNVKLSKPEIKALERKRRQDEAQSKQVKSGSRQADRRRSSGQLESATKASKSGTRKIAGMGPTFERAYASDERATASPGIMSKVSVRLTVRKLGQSAAVNTTFAPESVLDPAAKVSFRFRTSTPINSSSKFSFIPTPTRRSTVESTAEVGFFDPTIFGNPTVLSAILTSSGAQFQSRTQDCICTGRDTTSKPQETFGEVFSTHRNIGADPST